MQAALWILAEQVGFEPTLGQRPKPDFESGAFDHSATAPYSARVDGEGREIYAASAGGARG